MRKKADSDAAKKKKHRIKLWCQAVFERIKKIPWDKIFGWIFVIPWGRIFRAVGRFSRKRILPICCFLTCIGVLCGVLLLSVSSAVCDKTRDRIVTADELLAMDGEFDFIMVLGCRVYADGTMSHMLEDRVTTGISLYQAGIGSKMLMSGDSSSSEYYDEVGAMRQAAIEAGVPEGAIETDPLGLSTYDSVARLLEQYKGRRVVIVTQKYHLYRALYIAEKLGVEAYGVSADLRSYSTQFKSDVREIFARCKDVVYALQQPPAVKN